MFLHLDNWQIEEGRNLIIMINGAFGVGKTTTAMSLLHSVPNSIIFDPEEIGQMLRKIIDDETRLIEEQTSDFQDMELWRILTVNTAKELKLKYNKNLIVPMTIYKTDYFDYIYNGFKSIDKDTYHFCLIANEDTIYKRLLERGDEVGGWSFQQTKKCVTALRHDRFKEHIVTDELDIDEITNKIIHRIM